MTVLRGILALALGLSMIVSSAPASPSLSPGSDSVEHACCKHGKPAPARERRTQPGAEFGFEQAAAPTVRKSPSTTQAPSRAGGEFDLEP